MKYHVVEFLQENLIDIIPEEWRINNNLAFWPPFRGQKLFASVLKGVQPDQTWKKYQIKIAKSVDDYTKALKLRKKFELTSNLESEDSSTEKTLRHYRKIRSVVISSDEEMEEQLNNKRIKFPEFSKDLSNACTSASQAKQSSRKTQCLPADRQGIIFPEFSKDLSNACTSASQAKQSSRQIQCPIPAETQGIIFSEFSKDLSNACSSASQAKQSSRQIQCPIPAETQVLESSHNIYQDDFPIHESNETSEKKFQQYIIRKLEDIKAQGMRNEHLICKMLLKDKNYSDVISVKDLPALPLKTINEVNEMEEWLICESQKIKLIAYLSTVGGRDSQKCTRNIMRSIFSNELATQFNWKGKEPKRGFSKLILKSVVVSAVKQYKKDAIISDVEETIKTWLRYAQDRGGGRKNRQSRPGSRE